MRMIRRSASCASGEINGYSSGSEVIPKICLYYQRWSCSKDYEILEEIGNGETSIVYLAICKRGRLRNRQVALKKVSRTHIPTWTGHQLPAIRDPVVAQKFPGHTPSSCPFDIPSSNSPSPQHCFITFDLRDTLRPFSCPGTLLSRNSVYVSPFTRSRHSIRGRTPGSSQELDRRPTVSEKGICNTPRHQTVEHFIGGWL